MGGIACINVVYGALSAMAQGDLKYVIAYSSVSHMGLVMLGAATLTEAGLNGSVFQMFAHGVMTGLFFALVGLVYEKAHSREIAKMGGFGRAMPGIATAFTVGGLSSLGLPATSGFVAELLTFMGAWRSAVALVALPGGGRHVPDRRLRAPRHQADLLGSAVAALPPSRGCAGTEWVAICVLVGGHRRLRDGSRHRAWHRWTRRPCRFFSGS